MPGTRGNRMWIALAILLSVVFLIVAVSFPVLLYEGRRGGLLRPVRPAAD